jgi:shikimate kinase
MTRPNIIINGFMGTGKTTVGKMLAAKLGYDFFDTDELIVVRSGQTVKAIFPTHQRLYHAKHL